ncbi:hypothetical protein JZ751_028144 [Albula glossodonta]|uniref:Uncharacterized protein n=1 Tax=Albula glossodonta TaxID=121402 RepID=A0A8T2PD85_9TELE|nr:hypothetical protein JZ751_028144 [Albula glossodonta]
MVKGKGTWNLSSAGKKQDTLPATYRENTALLILSLCIGSRKKWTIFRPVLRPEAETMPKDSRMCQIYCSHPKWRSLTGRGFQVNGHDGTTPAGHMTACRSRGTHPISLQRACSPCEGGEREEHALLSLGVVAGQSEVTLVQHGQRVGLGVENPALQGEEEEALLHVIIGGVRGVHVFDPGEASANPAVLINGLEGRQRERERERERERR